MEGDNSAEDQGLLNKMVAYEKKAFLITPHLPVKHREYLTMIGLFYVFSLKDYKSLQTLER